MSSGPEEYFILIYDVENRSVEVREFGRDLDLAADTYTQLEADPDGAEGTEVVLVGADSIETIKKTHSHYFVSERSADDLFASVFREVEKLLASADRGSADRGK